MANSRELIIGIRTKDASKASKDLKDIDKSIKGAEKSTRGLSKEAENASRSLFKMAGVNLKGLGSKIGDVGGKINRFGKSVTKAMLPLTGAIAGGTKMFLDLDNSIRKVSTLSGDILPVDKIRGETRRISDMSGIASKEVAESMYEALSAGVDPSKVTGFTESAVKLTKAGFTDMSTVIDATTSVMNAYGDKAYDVSKIHDIMVMTQNKGKITVDELGKSLGRTIPVAAASGVALDQLGAAFSILTANGVPVAETTTSIRGLLTELSSSGTKADKALRQKTGKGFKDLTKDGKNLADVLKILNEAATANGQSIKDMFGNITAQTAADVLNNNGLDKFTEMQKIMNESGGTVDANFEAMLGPGEKLARVSNKIKNNLIDLGGQAVPYLEILGDKIGELSDWFKNLDDGTKSTIVQWGLILIAAGPVIAIFGTVVGVLGKVLMVGGFVLKGVGLLSGAAGLLGQGLLFIVTAAGPVVWIMMAVGFAVVWLIKHFQSIKQRAEELGGGMGWLKAILEEVKGSFSSMGSKALGVLNAIKRKWEAVKNFLKNPIQGVINLFTRGGGNVPSSGKGGGGHMNNGRGVRPASHASGLNFVPYDNYLANLHKGEIVLTAKASEEYRALGGDKDRVPRMVTTNNTTNTSTNTVNNNSPTYPPVNINFYGNSSPTDTAREVKSVVEDLFRDLRLQRV